MEDNYVFDCLLFLFNNVMIPSKSEQSQESPMYREPVVLELYYQYIISTFIQFIIHQKNKERG